MNDDRYGRWRNSGCPCGRVECEFHEPGDQEAQSCYGEDGAGDPMVANCEEYVPDPFVVAAWAERDGIGTPRLRVTERSEKTKVGSTDLLGCPFCGSPAETRADTSGGTLEQALVAEPMAKCSRHGCGARFIVMSASEWNTRQPNADLSGGIPYAPNSCSTGGEE